MNWFFFCRNPSYWGKLCFLSTPDGEKCGFVKNLAVTAMVSSMVKKPLIDTFVSCGMKKLDDKIPLQDISGKDRIFLNGSLLGVCADPGELISHLKSLRRSKLIEPQVCLVSRYAKLILYTYLKSQFSFSGSCFASIHDLWKLSPKALSSILYPFFRYFNLYCHG